MVFNGCSIAAVALVLRAEVLAMRIPPIIKQFYKGFASSFIKVTIKEEKPLVKRNTGPLTIYPLKLTLNIVYTYIFAAMKGANRA